jgi:very-short-patch-repair endonuclease
MPERCGSSPERWERFRKVELARLASRQHGVVARRQLVHLGIANALIGRWLTRADMHRLLPGVYAVGHTARSDAADLTAAVLYAGPGAMLGDATGVWWLSLTSRRPDVIHVDAPRERRSRPGIAIHGRRHLERFWHQNLPVAPLETVLLDYAATHSRDDIRYVLAQAEPAGWLDVDVLKGECRRGRTGSAALRKALSRHQPQLARTRSEFERRMIYLCERYAIPIPEFNVMVAGQLVDALWRPQRLIVELDGRAGHSHWGQIQSDHTRDLILRRARHTVHRYTWAQLEHDHAAVAQDVRRALAAAV